MTRLSLNACSALFICAISVNTFAQIKSDVTAPDNQRPTVLTASNGVTLVNIQTPSAAGVSRNTYSQFDVQNNGAILNNSRTNVQTQLGGWVQGNPWLATGSARVILNEVHSHDPSLLKGYMEVAGQAAQIVIANPSGVTCNGCGFVNANRATITTGKPILYNGNLDGFSVQDGLVMINGAGLDASTTAYADILARALQVNAGIWANQLIVVSGTNQIKLDQMTNHPFVSGESKPVGMPPVFAVDSSQLGGMYAGKITLLATEAGVGVRNAGKIIANAADIVLLSNGQLENSGYIASQVQTQINSSQDIKNSGTIAAQDNASIHTPSAINNSGKLIANKQINLESRSLVGDGSLLSQGDVSVKLTQDYLHTGQLLASGTTTLETAGSLTNQGTLQSGTEINLKAKSIDNQAKGKISADSVKLQATDTHTLTNRGLIDGIFASIETATLNNLGSGKIYGDQIAIKATTLNNLAETVNGVSQAPVIAARERLDIGASEINNREHALIFSAGDLAIGGNLDANKQATGQAALLNNASATIDALGHADIKAKIINNTNAHFSYETQVQSVQDNVREDPSGSQYRIFTRTISIPVATQSDPAVIRSGGDLRITSDLTSNEMSHIVAGGVLTVQGNDINNIQVYAPRFVHDVGTTYSLVYIPQSGYCGFVSVNCVRAHYAWWPSAYDSTTSNSMAVAQITPVQASGKIMSSFVSDSSTGIKSNLPNNSLFSLTPNLTAHYLIETDSLFTNYRTWLSSDYLLNALSINPETTQKRLGDGFYEQKLIREQVAQLTGRRFLDSYANDETQYAALMNKGATFAQSHQLTPGIALTAAQMAQLTSDIVWLVEKDITLPNGTTTKVLTPQLYVVAKKGDLQNDGALLSGDAIDLKLSNNVMNSGTIAGRTVVALNAENINNLNGRITGSDVGLAARTDINNIGGTIAAENNLVASAGHDVNLVSTTSTQTTAQSNTQSSRTHIDRVAGLYVTGGAGQLTLQAANDMNLTAAVIQNQGSDDTTLAANNNINLGSIKQSSSDHIVWDSNNFRTDSNKADVGTQIQVEGNLSLQAGKDLNVKAANVTSNQGDLFASAGNSVNLTAGEANLQHDEGHRFEDNSLLSSTTITTRDTLNQTSAQATTLSGKTTTVLANQNITIQGSNVVSDNGTLLAAKNNINITAATNTSSESHISVKKESGILSSGGIGVTIGNRQLNTDQKNTATTATASTVGSTQGNVDLQAGKNYVQTGSDVIALEGDINIIAQKITITEAREANKNKIDTKFKQSGVTVALTSPVISAIQTVQNMSEAASDTSDPRMKALAAANMAMAGKTAADAIKAGQGSTINGKENQIPTKVDANGKVTESRDANKADKIGGINLAVSIGSARSESQTTQASESARVSNVSAGNNLNVSATGDGKNSDITVQGSTLEADKKITFNAENEIKLLAAKNTAEQHSHNSSKSGNIGFSVGSDGLLATASVSGARGNADGSDVTWTNAHVIAGNQVVINSGADTTLKGAVVTAPQITANVSGNLNITSLQDTSKFDSKQQSIGASVAVGAGKSSGNLSLNKSKIDSDYAGVNEQSGLKAGDAGFAVNVANNTDLQGGAITSTQQAINDNKNNFSTGGTLTTSDLQNQASYTATSVGVNIGTGVSLDGKLAPQGSGAGIGNDSANASSITAAAISGVAGNKDVRTGDKETGIQKIFDADKVQKDINAQGQITQEFGRIASRVVANYATSKIDELKAQQSAEAAQTNPDLVKLQALKAELENWEEGGAYRIALHAAVGGITGDVKGAVSAGAAASAAPLLNDLQYSVTNALENAGANTSIAKAVAQVITGSTAAGIGSVASGGSTIGAATAFNSDANNRQLHVSEVQWLRENAKEFAKKQGITEKQAFERLTQQAVKEVDYLWRAQLSDGDDLAAKEFLGSNQQNFTNDLGEKQKLFTSTGQQLLRPEMFADTADPNFYKHFVQSGISRPLSSGLMKELQDSGIDVKNAAVDLAKIARENPNLVFGAIWGAVKNLPNTMVDSFVETGHAIGEGTAVAINDDIAKKLNAIYGRDVSGYQEALLAIRIMNAATGAAATAKVTTAATEKITSAISKKLDDVAAVKIELEEISKAKIQNQINKDNDVFSGTGEKIKGDSSPAFKGNTNLDEHLNAGGPHKQTVYGAHNDEAYHQAIKEKGFTDLPNQRQVLAPGIYENQYIGNDGRNYTKTTYDSAVWSHEQIQSMSRQAVVKLESEVNSGIGFLPQKNNPVQTTVNSIPFIVSFDKGKLYAHPGRLKGN